eukprot:CAMPEP_0194274120 /NCGR_PEP_ID=MMETSP0169-20130528/7283_1 /TAXON_ID=218684 /ORGANISM="Corethron pennatum, Strain L29A3" /LENGTH=333 /DNA_ID=CAMNT_0039017235 /DNA_START=15 /DNA_END=1016 /DNA_ORIENTATION=-
MNRDSTRTNSQNAASSPPSRIDSPPPSPPPAPLIPLLLFLLLSAAASSASAIILPLSRNSLRAIASAAPRHLPTFPSSHPGFFVMSSMSSSENPVSAIHANLSDVRARVAEASPPGAPPVRLVAVSKTKPISDIMDAYAGGQRVFGENYVQECIGKAGDVPEDVQWHFMGPVQSNKAAALVRGCGRALRCVESVATIKLASKLDKAAAELVGADGSVSPFHLGIYIQVNTSGEETKSGAAPADVPDLAKKIRDVCPNLKLAGLMTIGAPGDYSCFDVLASCRVATAGELGVPEEALELSMGMSGDFEEAIRRGATNVRVGSTIFGARDYSNKK